MVLVWKPIRNCEMTEFINWNFQILFYDHVPNKLTLCLSANVVLYIVTKPTSSYWFHPFIRIPPKKSRPFFVSEEQPHHILPQPVSLQIKKYSPPKKHPLPYPELQQKFPWNGFKETPDKFLKEDDFLSHRSFYKYIHVFSPNKRTVFKIFLGGGSYHSHSWAMSMFFWIFGSTWVSVCDGLVFFLNIKKVHPRCMSLTECPNRVHINSHQMVKYQISFQPHWRYKFSGSPIFLNNVTHCLGLSTLCLSIVSNKHPFFKKNLFFKKKLLPTVFGSHDFKKTNCSVFDI